MFDKLKKAFTEKGNVILLELDDWYDWYKDPQKFHHAVVTHLINQGSKVETISLVDRVTSNKISILFIDEIKYELSVRNNQSIAPVQTVILKKL